LITNDKNLYYQQKIIGYPFSIININTRTNRYDDVVAILISLKETLNSLINNKPQPGTNYFIL